jgi:hypothetical protein
MATATCSLGTFDSFFFTLLMIVILSLSLYHSLPYSIDLPWPCADRHVHNSDLMAVLREAATSPGMFFSATGDETIGESSCAFERAPRSVGRLLRFGSSREVFPRSRIIYSCLIPLRWGCVKSAQGAIRAVWRYLTGLCDGSIKNVESTSSCRWALPSVPM